LEIKRFDVPDLDALQTVLDLDEIELHRVYDLSPRDMVRFEQTYGVAFDDKSLSVRMAVDHGTAFDKYDELASHTGRELLLMLAGKKPFAHFHRFDRPEEDGIVPEALFEPYVRAGRFIRIDQIVEMTPHGASRRIFYAIAGEEWRIEAYKTLWRLAEKYGRWDETLERMEGYLLGYETDIDPFYR
jgi:hypothetical protein